GLVLCPPLLPQAGRVLSLAEILARELVEDVGYAGPELADARPILRSHVADSLDHGAGGPGLVLRLRERLGAGQPDLEVRLLVDENGREGLDGGARPVLDTFEGFRA